MQTTPDAIVITPNHKEIGSVIWLHGLGANGSDFVPIVNELNLPSSLPLRFIFPHAPIRPITLNNGYAMPGWFDIYSLNRFGKIDDEGIAESVKTVEKLMHREMELGIPSDKIVLAGFSQGAAMALTTGLQFNKKLAGILALSGYLPSAEKVLANASPTNFTTPIMVAHGTDDIVLPYTLSLELLDVLQKNKYLANLHTYQMGHTVCAEEVGDIAEWLQKVIIPNM